MDLGEKEVQVKTIQEQLCTSAGREIEEEQEAEFGQGEDEVEDETKQESKAEKKDVATAVEENAIERQSEDCFFGMRTNSPSVDGLAGRCHDRGKVGRRKKEYGPADKKHGNVVH